MKNASIHRKPTLLLQALVILIGIGVLAFLLWEPHVEGVNTHATTLFEIYFDDPFLAYAYIASVPFFFALTQAFMLLGYAGRNELFSQRSEQALRTIKYCAIVMIAFIVMGAVWLLLGESDDRPPILAMGAVATLLSIIVAVAAGLLERKVRNTVGHSVGY